MRDEKLRAICIWIPIIAGSVALGSILFTPLRPALHPLTIIVGATAALLFLRMLFSRAYRRGVDAANLEMRGHSPWPGRPKTLFDPEWGLFGRRAGPPALLWVRAVLVMGITPLALLRYWIGSDVLMLWFAGAFVALELSIMHAAAQERQS